MTQTLDSWPAGATATMNVTYTQANAAGGAVKCEISPTGGSEFILLSARGVNSGTNGLGIELETATGGALMVALLEIAAGPGVNGNVSVGNVGTAVTSTANVTGLGYPFIVSGTQAIRIVQTAAGAQNDLFQVLVNVRCKGAVPTVTHANSTNAANVTATAGAESFTTV